MQRLLEDGFEPAEIARQLGLTKSTIAYHCRRVGEPVDPRFAHRYDWAEIQRFYDEGHTPAECQARFGCSKASWNDARRRGRLLVRPTATPLDEWLVAGRKCARFHLRHRLVVEGLKEGRCEECGLAEWRGAQLVTQLHHVNGDGLDNRLANLKLLWSYTQMLWMGLKSKAAYLPG